MADNLEEVDFPKITLQKIVGNFLDKVRKFYMNGMVI